MTDAPLQHIEIETAPEPTGSIIWLHGLGADGHDFEPIVPELRLPADQPLRFIFPHAPERPVTINGGMRMRAWYDIVALDGSQQDMDGIEDSSRLLREFVAREIERGIPASRIVLAGFSQGGAIALHTALRYPERLAGLMALSTYLPVADRLGDERSEANRELPIFMAHGSYDPMIPVGVAEYSRDQLAYFGYAVQWQTYPMQHAVCPEEIAAIRDWLLEVLPKNA